jgi:hypothetical protein
MTSDRREPSDDQIDAVIERMAREENDELARAWGQGILDAATNAMQGRADEDRALLDAIGRASAAKDKE